MNAKRSRVSIACRATVFLLKKKLVPGPRVRVLSRQNPEENRRLLLCEKIQGKDGQLRKTAARLRRSHGERNRY